MEKTVKGILQQAKCIAIVGLSPKEERPSNRVARYLLDMGYTVIPVNPGQTEILGQKCYPSLAELDKDDQQIDIVTIFRKSEDIIPIVDEILQLSSLPALVWMQLGIINNEAAIRAEAAGMAVVMDKCIKIEHEKL